MDLKDKHIVLGITASIAAFKAATLCRLLIKQGATVKVVMTPLATEFITPVTMATLSQNSVLLNFFKHDDGSWNSHVELGLWADLMLIAPASANTMAKMAHGICDNLLLTTYLSVRCPVMFAPAMDMDMYKHPTTQRNVEQLKSIGHLFVEPGDGELASGLIGKGRMAEPEQIVEDVIQFFDLKKKFHNKKILITAGPTYEPIDAVRFVGNYSTGKMGIALAKELSNQGADVKLVLGPVANIPEIPNCDIIKVQTAQQMFDASVENFPSCDGAFLAAAVADYTIDNPQVSKIKRTSDKLQLTLNPTKDIAAHLGKMKVNDQFLVGFALETDNEIENAKGKMKRKNFDAIVLNSLNDPGAGFGHDTNRITLISNSAESKTFSLKSKTEVAKDIVNYVHETVLK
ncbi:MAG: bifunctional phosphopantothenoylcysteine decarboxylase/phosphopantothenate--cysteine ligase CoaBC [Salinivirgaceae bacterium]|nr:bifunctional phosphopantothenoylcysteine decarboxylase/phosphopantothenate--cysteine ligase CoaBC [Salinivirgaceae bacterium]MDD4745867.1 bifunctional phosphopantothenoylcysteine decarboxylase/phosphopantothenate--cysteine ligase CoaBC [Salinivirgaceae bacterium]MDY0278933.1 bifunctional phosphopantothenoylcysteine decarboxylase/phosphopantothenate--cysteine ligase CoaBC [Salinivirgaceae bacterium]